MSSAGLSRTAPPHTTQPPSRSTTRRIPRSSRHTGATVSIASAVPAGDVMARDEVFGITRPAAATIGTTSIVVRFPGSPPTQCLSRIGRSGQVMRSPASSIARVRWVVSSRSSRPPAHPVMKAARCTAEYRPAAISPTIARMALSSKGAPAILARTWSRESSGVGCDNSAWAPSRIPSCRHATSDRPASPSRTKPSVVTFNVARTRRWPARTSIRACASQPSDRQTAQSRGM